MCATFEIITPTLFLGLLLSFPVRFVDSAETLKVYRSSEPIESLRPLAGLQLDTSKTSVTITKGLTLCVRLNYRLLAENSKLFIIESPEWGLMWFKVNYRASFFGFGTGTGVNTKSNWIIKDLEKNRFMIWMANNWHHVCIAYDKQSSHIALVKVMIVRTVIT